MSGADDTTGPKTGGEGRKPILQGDDLPREDAIAPSPAEPDWDDAEAEAPGFDRLELGDDDRLPWLESPDDIGDEGVDGGRIVGFVLLALVALAMIVGAVWFVSNRTNGPAPADGRLIRAEAGPYKVRPENPGGKTFEGTGDTSFAVSEGQTRAGKIAGSEAARTPEAKASAAPAAGAAPAASASGVGVQVGAYSNAADAEAGWATLSGRHPALAALKHRVVEGRADIGTVYRLQAVAADLDAANTLCAALKASGQGCQVKR
ncbi:MAG TPA: SPOR domain-containing protein [Novosphingobium sp.]|nr:SPOR domain-containing protein [Novosphingobium sp.]